jgi:hypothetical protein
MIVKTSRTVGFLLGFIVTTASHAETSPDLREADVKLLVNRLQRLVALVKQQQLLIKQLQVKVAREDIHDFERF